jgi:predicted phage gp36 major capsid-like protein
MKTVIIILIVLAVLLAAALIWTAMKRKKDQVGRERASELRSDAAGVAAEKREREARAREAEAEAERVRAQADKLEVRAQEERTGYDQTRAQEEHSLREADRLDPDVDHQDPDYRPGLDSTGTHRGEDVTHRDHRTNGSPAHDQGHGTGAHRRSSSPADPVPPGPETIVPDHERDRRDQP